MNRFIYENSLIFHFVKDVFPQVDQALDQWREYGLKIPDPLLKEQALASIKTKRFHCQGGSIYALYPGVDQEVMIRFIVAFQTISDFLDNLCDRTGYEDEKSFRQLHRAMHEALQPDLSLSDYYAYYPYKNDGGYLKALVEECRRSLNALPLYHMVQEDALALVSLYCDLQCLKHLAIELREEALIRWATPYLNTYPDLSQWEFGAASGSTLGVFMLCAASYQNNLDKEEVKEIKKAYFPHISGLHILLDYFIDQAEDREEGDLNFIFYYRNPKEVEDRLSYFIQQSLSQAAMLKKSGFHLTVIQGMLAMYLSDQKAGKPLYHGTIEALLAKCGKSAAFWYLICKLLRRIKAI
ncbi:MAG: tetraprenyl-beta-curcumene synthase family protein [Dehalobacterium sp.]